MATRLPAQTASARPRVSLTGLKFAQFIALGMVAGYLSGLFGIGGGILIVPLLVFFGVDITVAAPTSLAAVLPISLVGAVSYASLGRVDWLLAGLLALGAVIGAQLGSRILGRLSRAALQYGFAGFLLVVAASLFLTVPAREAQLAVDLAHLVAAVLTGLVVGTLASILGIGGGVMIVPALMLGFGASDLVARGTAIAMMVPTALSGTVAHVRAGRADLRIAAAVAGGAITTTTLGALSARALDPRWGSWLFGALLIAIAGQLAWRVRRAGPRA